jgi:hypothetical protein
MFDEIGKPPNEPMERGTWLAYRGLYALLWLAALGACLWKHGVSKPIYPVVYSVMVLGSLKLLADALRSAPPTKLKFHDLRLASWLIVASVNLAFVILN